MSTTSTISILNNDGTVHGVPCLKDGYLRWNGEMLYNHYKDINKVKELVSLGDISILHPEINPPKGATHNFNNRHPDVTVFYGRDRGESGSKPRIFASLSDYLEVNYLEDFAYIFNENKNEWYFLEPRKNNLILLKDVLLNCENVSEETKKIIIAENTANKLEVELSVKDRGLNQLNKPKI